MKEKRRHTSGITGTIIFHAVLLILLYLFGFKQLIPDTEEGIMINFGDAPTGTGNIEPKPTPVAQTTPPPPPPQPTTTPQTSTPSASDAEKLNTQDFEESVAMKSAEEKRKKEEEQKRKQQEAEAEKKRRQEIEETRHREALEAEKQKKIEEERIRKEQERLEQERLERERKEREEREAKERQAKEISQRTANVFAAAGKANGNSTSEGNTGGTGNQGSLNGDPNSKSRTGTGLGSSGNSYSLAGRSLVGTLPTPVYNIQEEGIVVVQIEVDRSGRVISATPMLRGSTTQNSQLWKKAEEAALRAKFNANPAATSKQLGTITYHFQLD